MLPPTPSSGRASPSISEGSVSEEEQLNDKPSNADESTEDIKKGMDEHLVVVYQIIVRVGYSNYGT